MNDKLLDNSRFVTGVILGISALASLFLFWLIYFKEPAEAMAERVAWMPALNASLNFLSASCLCFGYYYIRKREISRHQVFMKSALVFSALFLISYLIYHHFHGDTPFTGEGTIRVVYFFILISHIVLSIAALPLVLLTAFFALRSTFDKHKKLARWTWPIWLYVSVTGVLVFFLLKQYG